ncbi:MAG TPA: response regulator [Alphaproteobacteria bacterium]|nr:response regulator [Alphaproteobacteria bacterium]
MGEVPARAAEWQGGAKPRVLVVEDEYLVALLVEDMLQTLGYEVAEIAPNLAAATTAAEAGEFDVAILDVNLNGTMSGPVAEILTRRNIPFIFATGYGKAGPHEQFAHAPSLQKPFEESDLSRMLSSVMGRG